VFEAAGAGTDQVRSSVSFTLAGNVENLTLTGVAAINGTGNGLANRIIGNDAANVINGGAGADTMQGGNGDDIYVVDNAGDVVVEATGAGTDFVWSSVSFTLAGNVENLGLTGVAVINGTGNALANRISGNDAANVINGGVGADTMQGGNGDDTYVVDNAGDVVFEALGAGADMVLSSVSFTLAGNIENLTLTGVAAINGTGNGLGNVIAGNAAANALDGLAGADTLNGGLGNDTLTGGFGADFFLFDTTPDAVSNVDTVTDFAVTADKIVLSLSVYSALVAGPLAATAFVIGAAAADEFDRIIYDDSLSALLYDADGTGAEAAVQFAAVGAGLLLNESHFLVV
jgi:Ca2+-binding RTX toxin-like protein